MQSHGTGALRGSRRGAYNTVHTFVLGPNNQLPSVAGIKFATVDGTPQDPVLYRAKVYIETAITGGTVSAAMLRIGTTQGGSEVLASTSVFAGSGTTVAPAAAAEFKMALAPQDLFVGLALTGSGATAGRVVLILELFDTNVKAFTDQGD